MTEIIEPPHRAVDEHTERTFDGIEENNNPLPKWWIKLFYITIVFSFAYMAWFHLPFSPGKSLAQEYSLAMGNKQELELELERKQDAGSVFDLSKAKSDAVLVASGKAVFAANCASCHGPQGGGLVGPNLTDDFWLHGSSTQDLVKIIAEGVPAKGMPGWKTILGSEKIHHLVGYIATLRGTHPTPAKEAQGEKGWLN